MTVRDAQQEIVHLEAAGDHDSGDLLREDVVEEFLAHVRRLVAEVSHLARAEKLEALEGELLEITGHGERGTVQRLLGDHVIETLGAGEELHLEHVLERFEELTHRDGFGAGIGSGVGHGRQSLKPSPR